MTEFHRAVLQSVAYGQLRRRKRLPGEKVQKYVLELESLAQQEIGEEEVIRRIIEGLGDSSPRQCQYWLVHDLCAN